MDGSPSTASASSVFMSEKQVRMDGWMDELKEKSKGIVEMMN